MLCFNKYLLYLHYLFVLITTPKQDCSVFLMTSDLISFLCFFEMLMSAPAVTTTVTSLVFVPTIMDRSRVTVSEVIQGTEHGVQVNLSALSLFRPA